MRSDFVIVKEIANKADIILTLYDTGIEKNFKDSLYIGAISQDVKHLKEINDIEDEVEKLNQKHTEENGEKYIDFIIDKDEKKRKIYESIIIQAMNGLIYLARQEEKGEEDTLPDF